MAINETVFDVVLSYLKAGDNKYVPLLNKLGTCVAIILEIGDIQFGNEANIFKKKGDIFKQIQNADYESILPDEAKLLKELLEQISSSNDWKLPGIRTLFQWLTDFEKVVAYRARNHEKLKSSA